MEETSGGGSDFFMDIYLLCSTIQALIFCKGNDLGFLLFFYIKRCLLKSMEKQHLATKKNNISESLMRHMHVE